MAIINPDRIKAELLRFYCAQHWGFDVVAIEFTAATGIAAVALTQPEVILVSLALPELSAAELIRQIQESSPGSRLIAQAAQCSEYLVNLIAGAAYHGLVLDTDDSLASLGQVIERARQGLRTISARIAQCQQALRTRPDAFPKLLSRREQKVLVCIAHAMTDAEIGLTFNVSASTALSHRKRIMSKLGIHSTPKLMRYAAEKGFNAVPPPVPPEHPA